MSGSCPASDQIARDCIVVRLRLLNRVVTKLYDDAFRPLGVKTSQMNILVVTDQLGLARPAKVCERLKLDLSTLSRNVERMRAKGWLVISEDKKDARARQFRLSVKGRRLLERAFPAWEEAQEQTKALLGAPETAAIVRAVARIRGDPLK